MKIISKGRGEGKTAELVKMSAETQIPILHHYPPYVEDVAEELGLSIPRPISIREFNIEKPEKVLIDDVDFMLKRLLGTEVVAAALTESYGCATFLA